MVTLLFFLFLLMAGLEDPMKAINSKKKRRDKSDRSFPFSSIKKKGGPLGPPFRMGRAMGPNYLCAPLTLTGEVALLSSLGTKTTRTGTHS